MSTAARLRAGSLAHARSFLRHPLHFVFLVVLPPVVIEVYGVAMASFPEVPLLEMVPATIGRINGAVFAAAFLAALVGLFQVISATAADGRLQLAGYRRWELFLTRLATILLVAFLAAGAAFVVLAWRIDVAAPLAALGALALAGVIYGLLGVLIGTVVPKELEGSLLLVFVADFDTFLASGLADIDSAVVNLLPLHYPHALFSSAVRDGSVAGGDVVGAVVYLLVALLAVMIAYVRLTDETAPAAHPGGVIG